MDKFSKKNPKFLLFPIECSFLLYSSKCPLLAIFTGLTLNT